MNIWLNSVYTNKTTNISFRVLDIFPQNNEVVVIEMNKDRKMPYYMQLDELDEDVKTGIYIEDKKLVITLKIDNLTEKERATMEEEWSHICDFVQDIPSCYNKILRNDFVKFESEKSGYDAQKIHRLLYKYWCSGKTKLALVPAFRDRGGAAKQRNYTVKVGRPVKNSTNNLGLNIGSTEREQIQKIMNKYYNKSPKYGMKFTYQKLLETYYMNKEKTEFLDAFPSFSQFKYHAQNFIDIKRKIGAKKYERNNRELLGNSRNEASGPQDKYQIDATIADIYLVSMVNRKNIVGKPVLYFVTDVFSRMIVGFYVGLEGPSWNTAMIALNYTFREKVELCKEYGMDITEEQWPSYGFPRTLLVDNGELISKNSNAIIEELGIHVENHSAWRPDLKAIVEQSFHLLNQSTKMLLPGSIQPDFRMRGGQDYRLDAKLTIKEFGAVIIHYILKHNSKILREAPQMDEDILKDNVPAIPIRLWNWGIRNRTGSLNMPAVKDFQIKLLPKEGAKITARGIQFKKINYTCEQAEKEGWFSRARMKGNVSCEVRYDPRCLNGIYLCNEDGSYSWCVKTSADNEKYAGWMLEEIIYNQELRKAEQIKHQEEMMIRDIDLNVKIDDIIKTAEKEAREEKVVRISKNKAIKNIKKNRANENKIVRAEEAIVPIEKKSIAKKISEPSNEIEANYSKMIAQMQEEEEGDW